MPVARVGDIVGGFAIVQSLGIKTMAELVSYAKQNRARSRMVRPGSVRPHSSASRH